MNRNTKILWALWIILALVGGLGMIERLTMGERLAAYTS